MKKLIALLAVFAMLFCLGSVAFADEEEPEDVEVEEDVELEEDVEGDAEDLDVLEISWADFQDIIEEEGLEGYLVPIVDAGLTIWVYDGLQPVEAEDEELEGGLFFADESEEHFLAVVTMTDDEITEDMDLEDEELDAEDEEVELTDEELEELDEALGDIEFSDEDMAAFVVMLMAYGLEEEDYAENVMLMDVNGLPAVYYTDTEEDTENLFIVTASGDVVMVMTNVVDEEDDYSVINSVMMGSVQANDEITWDDMADLLDAAGVEGSFYGLEDPNVMIWIPDVMEPAELADEDIEAGLLGDFVTEDEEEIVVWCEEYDGTSLEDMAAELEGEAGTADLGKINGQDALIYTEEDILAAYIVTEDGYLLNVIGAPYTDEGFATILSLVVASVQAT